MNTRSSSHSTSQNSKKHVGKRERVFGRHARLRTHAQIALMKRCGKSVARRTCVVSALLPPPDGSRRVGFIISRRYSPKAVVRNRARRVLREAYRQLHPELKTAWIALIPRARMRDAKTGDVVQELRDACRQLELLDARRPHQDVESG